MARARSPVQGVELWIVKDEALVLGGGAYGPHTEFARVSARSRFRFGEGLPGAVWATERALAWHELGSHFVRAEYAAAAGIHAAIGFPWFRGNEFAGVLIFLLTSATESAACIELWNHDEGIDVLRHGGGHYVNTPELAKLSELLQFPYAAGLPGLTWSTGMPVTFPDVRSSNEFVRADLAARAGLKRAVGVPIFRQRRVTHVLTLMGAEVGSFIQRFELFGQGEFGLVEKVRFDESAATAGLEAPASAFLDKELADEARIQRMPVVRGTTESAGSAIQLALPVHDGARLRGVVCLEF
jgi:hypothetical protein